MKTTLNKIRKYMPCVSGWTKLMRSLNKTQADDEELTIVQILDSNDFMDALWCLRAVEGRDREIRQYMVWCARQVQHLMTDPRSIAALDVAERFANGLATKNELAAARDAGAAGSAAWDAAMAAARAAAWAATGSDENAAWSAARAAGSAAWYAARAAAGDAAWAAEDAAWAAGSAAWDAQEKKLRELCAWCEQNPVGSELK